MLDLLNGPGVITQVRQQQGYCHTGVNRLRIEFGTVVVKP